MTAAAGTTPRVAAAGVCCVVAALAYSGAVRMAALLAFVLPAVVVMILLTAALARLSLRLAAGGGLLVALGVAEIVNVVSGSSYGPAARSTFAAAAFAVVAVAAVLSPAPALFLIAVVGILIGALGLGAGAEVAPVAVATAVVAVVALAVVEAQTRRSTRRPQLAAAIIFALLVGVLTAAVALQAERRLPGPPAALAPGAVQPSIRPPQLLGEPHPRPTTTATSRANPTSNARPSAPAPHTSAVSRSTIWLTVLAVVVFLMLTAALWVLWVALSWRLLRRRLRTGSDVEQVAGAWVWSARRLRAAGWPMSPSTSVDAVAAGEGLAGLPRPLRAGVREVAASTMNAVYAPPADRDYDQVAVWVAADAIGHGAVRVLPRTRRMAFALRPVNSGRSRTTATAPEGSKESRS